MTDLNTLINLASDAYAAQLPNGEIVFPGNDNPQPGASPIYTTVGTYSPLVAGTTPQTNSDTGFRAQSHFSSVDNTLVLTFTGTNDEEDGPSNRYISGVSTPLGSQAEQIPEAILFAQTQIAIAQGLYGDDIQIVFNGHSLGGYLATVTHNTLDVGTATVFNAPGVGAGFAPSITDNDVTYVYSNPSDWQEVLETVALFYGVDSSDIHNVGDRVSDNLLFFMNAGAHSMTDIVASSSAGDQPITLDTFLDIWAAELSVIEDISNSRVRSRERLEILNKYDIDGFQAEVSDRAFGDNCFPAGTLISLADGSTKAIENLSLSDVVLAPTSSGDLVPAQVDKLFTNTTSDFIRLSFADGREDLVATPGHRFMTETGDFMEIGHMLRLGGGSVRVVDQDGSIVVATGEVIAYSAETEHMFEQSATKSIAFEGNAVLKEDVDQGWTTYNFEVREHHTYLAGGIRVHNDSILSTLQDGDKLVALNDDLTDAAVLRDVNGDGNLDFVAMDGFRLNGEPTSIAKEYVYYAQAGDDFATDLAAVVASGPDAVSSVFDPTAGQNADGTVADHGPVSSGNTWDDGAWGDDIEEAFFDDVLNVDVTDPASIGFDPNVQYNAETPARDLIDALYENNGEIAVNIAGERFDFVLSLTGLLAASALLDAIAGQSEVPDDAYAISAWILDIPLTITDPFFGTEIPNPLYLAMVEALEPVFENIGAEPDGIVSGTDNDDAIDAAYVDADGDVVTDGDDIMAAGAGDDFYDGGAGQDTVQLDGGLDEFVFEFTDALIVNDTGATGVDEGRDILIDVEELAFSDGSRAEIVQGDTSITITGYADAASERSSRVVIDTTGDGKAWDVQTNAYAADGTTLTDRTVSYDDGRLVDVDYDASGVRTQQTNTDTEDAYAWDLVTNTYAADGTTLTDRTVSYDDGRLVDVDYDANGVRTQQTNTDTGNAHAWDLVTNTYAADGTTLTDRTVSYDDGRLVDVDYDANGVRTQQTNTDTQDAHEWDLITNIYATDGTTLTDRTVSYDDGRLLDVEYDAAGNRTSQTMTDVENAYDWASYTQTYDTDGNLVDTVYEYDFI